MDRARGILGLGTRIFGYCIRNEDLYRRAPEVVMHSSTYGERGYQYLDESSDFPKGFGRFLAGALILVFIFWNAEVRRQILIPCYPRRMDEIPWNGLLIKIALRDLCS